jgi:hypothetical protein
MSLQSQHPNFNALEASPSDTLEDFASTAACLSAVLVKTEIFQIVNDYIFNFSVFNATTEVMLHAFTLLLS